MGVGDGTAALATSVVVPPNAFLHFAHGFSFQAPNFDGGVVEYSTNGGTTWVDAGTLFDANGYTGALAAGTDNPLTGRAAFVADSHGYRSSRLNLAPLAGQSARFRWRLGLNSTGTALGWLVDDIRIYVCSGALLTSVSPNSAAQGQALIPVAITGDSTHFVQGQTSASFGSGITVQSTTVTDATHATATVTIAPDAALGPRDVIMTTGAGVCRQGQRVLDFPQPRPDPGRAERRPARDDRVGRDYRTTDALRARANDRELRLRDHREQRDRY